MDKLSELSLRVEQLEGEVEAEDAPSSWSADRCRVEHACAALGIVHRMYRTTKDYYGKSLEGRRAELHAPAVQHLCKSVLFKNTEWERLEGFERENAQYVLVVVQYAEKIDSNVLPNAVRNLIPEEKRLPKNKYAFRLATQEESDAVAGFQHNAVAPVGLKQDVPIVVAKAITELSPPVIYLGGGEVDLKLQVNVSQFCEATKAFVAPISTPRDPAELLLVTEDDGSSGEGSTANEVSSTSQTASSSPASIDVNALSQQFDQLEIRVGHIISAERHPESDKLIIEKIQVGDAPESGQTESQPRQILSGLAKHYNPEDLVGKKVAVLCNLKPSKLAGLMSCGMVLCAVGNGTDGEVVRVVEAPADAAPGARIGLFGSKEQAEPASSSQLKKKKIFEGMVEMLQPDELYRATYGGALWSVKELENAEDNNVSCCRAEPLPLPAIIR